MCGIFGYVGNRTAAPLLLEGLRTLEYRGYDSAGIYVPQMGVIKAAGPIDNLAAKLPTTFSGTSGIAHTRWATHGAPTEANAHPHSDMSGVVWVVHNGIIENYREIKEGLTMQGMHFQSETDTEVLAKLIGTLYSGNIAMAVQEALKRVRGTYGLAVMSQKEPGVIVVARMGSPIVLGLGADGNYVASDPAALLPYTKDVIYLEDGEIAVITKDTHIVKTISGLELKKPTETIAHDLEVAQKNGYAHFMEKEIFEAPEVIKNTIRGRLLSEKGRAKLGGLELVVKELASLHRLQIVGCGSAYYAGQVGRYMLEEFAGMPVEVELGSEYRYKKNYPERKSALLAVSQSGETADTLASIREGKRLGLTTLGIINAVGSTIARETKAGVYNHAGPEVAVASTKAFISQLTVFALLTLLIGRERGMKEAEGKEIVAGLQSLSETLLEVLKLAPELKTWAREIAAYEDVMFIGRKFHAPIAYEGALKLKEVTYIHAEAYAGGELKHGPIALLGKQFPVIALAPHDDVYEKMVSNIEEAKARQAPVFAFVTKGDVNVVAIANRVIELPKVHPLLQPIISTVPLHLLAYYVGVERGFNVDRPRNLAKSVTVE
ncbi:MAG: glutamine--fructose-6-phosphate aminotransferase [Parcubacteria group bacterium CG2_30_44_11]|nr:MAG: glutamine--fructose-6-phosphate aminotransferase [Parcubacteria group bacterium CG2_30_44_11]